MELRNTLPSAGAPTKIGNPQPIACGQQSRLDAIAVLLLRIISAQPVSQFRTGHLLLEFRPQQYRCEELILIEQDRLVESHVGHADHAFIPQFAIVAEDRHFIDGIFGVLVQAAVAVVIADGVGRAEIRYPAGLE